MSEALSLTRHAEVRSNQRGIRIRTMDVLLTYGESRIRNGAEVIYMDRESRLRARDALGRTEYARLERALDAYLVLADGRVMSCAHRKRKLRFKG